MSELRTETAQATGAANGAPAPEPEARLRHLLGEQRRLRELLEQTRAALDRVNADLLGFQNEYCTDPAREREYDSALARILGFDPRFDPKEIEEALKDPQGIDEFLAELERHG